MKIEVGPPNCQLRSMTVEDIPQIMEIEKTSFSAPWNEEGFYIAIKGKASRPMVLERDRRIVGYFVFEFTAGGTHIMNLAIHPDHRRQGYGSLCLSLIEKAALRFLELARSEKITPRMIGREASQGVALSPTQRQKKGETSLDEREGELPAKIYLEVAESNLPAQLFYRNWGYRATRILRNYYPKTDEDGYRMELVLQRPPAG